MISDSHNVDLIEEFRLRRLAREYYVSSEYREPGWHPIILEEMGRKDSEATARTTSPVSFT